MLWRSAPGYLALATVDGRTVEINGPGCDIWARLVDWISEEELVAVLSVQYGAEEQIMSDVRSLLQGLRTQGYVDQGD